MSFLILEDKKIWNLNKFEFERSDQISLVAGGYISISLPNLHPALSWKGQLLNYQLIGLVFLSYNIATLLNIQNATLSRTKDLQATQEINTVRLGLLYKCEWTKNTVRLGLLYKCEWTNLIR